MVKSTLDKVFWSLFQVDGAYDGAVLPSSVLVGGVINRLLYLIKRKLEAVHCLLQ